jgi:spore germination cell wall hydrolase CwlJ-like protein
MFKSLATLLFAGLFLWASSVTEPPQLFYFPIHLEAVHFVPPKEPTYCLAKVIYFEARNQDITGRMGVASVALNRFTDWGRFKSLCDVVFDGCSFSWVCQKNLPREPLDTRDIHEKEGWDMALSLSRVILISFMNGTMVDPTNGSHYYHEFHLTPPPYWANMALHTVDIGEHRFYR